MIALSHSAARPRVGGLLPDRLAVAHLIDVVPPGLVDQVIAETGIHDGRDRAVPAQLAMYFALALWLWPDDDYASVLARLCDGLDWTGAYVGAGAPAASSALRARDALGPEPVLALLRRLTPAGDPQRHAEDFRGLALRSLDACPVGVSSQCGFCLARIMTLTDWHGVVQAASWAPGAAPMGELAGLLFAQVMGGDLAGSLLFAGPAFRELWQVAGEAGAHVVADVPPGVSPRRDRQLGDATHLADFQGARLRIIARPGGGTLATTLTDPSFAPAEELVWLHACRWDLTETIARVCGPASPSLRSRSAAGLSQEVWALLALYQALARPRIDSAAARVVGSL